MHTTPNSLNIRSSSILCLLCLLICYLQEYFYYGDEVGILYTQWQLKGKNPCCVIC